MHTYLLDMLDVREPTTYYNETQNILEEHITDMNKNT